MKKKNRRNSTADFKAWVALEAARGVKKINEIAAEHDLHPGQVGQWKKELLRLEPDLPFGPVSIHGQPTPLVELLHLLVLTPVTARQ